MDDTVEVDRAEGQHGRVRLVLVPELDGPVGGATEKHIRGERRRADLVHRASVAEVTVEVLCVRACVRACVCGAGRWNVYAQ